PGSPSRAAGWGPIRRLWPATVPQWWIGTRTVCAHRIAHPPAERPHGGPGPGTCRAGCPAPPLPPRRSSGHRGGSCRLTNSHLLDGPDVRPSRVADDAAGAVHSVIGQQLIRDPPGVVDRQRLGPCGGHDHVVLTVGPPADPGADRHRSYGGL